MDKSLQVKVQSPEQCPFRYWAPYYHQWDASDYCSYKRNLNKNNDNNKSCSCVCVDGIWRQSCPLVANDILIAKVE